MLRRCLMCGTTNPPRGWLTVHGVPQSRCRECDAKRSRSFYAANAEACRERSLRYYRAHPGDKRRRSHAERKLRGKKYLANAIITTAVYLGSIKKPTNCEDCGTPTPKAKLHGHHADYSKPRDVRWLCARCHGKKHRKVA